MGAATEGPLLVVCGEHLEQPERAALAAWLAAGAPQVGALVVEQLCAQPSALAAALVGRPALAVVVAGCDHAGATGALRQAVAAGLDTARVGTVSLAAALAEESAVERACLLEAICLAGARKADVLAGEPLAGRERLQLRRGLSRRTLLTPWREAPRHTAVLDENRCLGAPRCGACVSTCSERALRAEGGLLRVDPLRCTSCGACVPFCPTGALSLPGAALAGVAAELETLLGGGVDAITLTCERAAASLTPAAREHSAEPATTLGLPCLAMASPGLLLGLLVAGARVGLAPCPTCPNDQAVSNAVGFAGRVLHALGRGDLLARLSVAGVDRACEPTAAAPQRSAHPLDTLVLREPAATNVAVARLLDGPGDHSRSDEAILDASAPGGVVRIDPGECSLCGACVLACPTGAIARSEVEPELILDAARCLGCGRCAAACPEEAVAVIRGVDLQGLRTGPLRLRASIPSWTCARCGTIVDDDPILAPVARRLADHGASTTLVASLRRCSSCGAPAALSGDPTSREPARSPRPTEGR